LPGRDLAAHAAAHRCTPVGAADLGRRVDEGSAPGAAQQLTPSASDPIFYNGRVLTLDNFVGGRWVQAQTSEFFDVHNPALGDVIGRTPLSTAADVDAAVQAAAKAFPAWRDTPVNTRAQVLYRVKQLMELNFDEMARLVTTEHGKTLD